MYGNAANTGWICGACLTHMTWWIATRLPYRLIGSTAGSTDELWVAVGAG